MRDDVRRWALVLAAAAIVPACGGGGGGGGGGPAPTPPGAFTISTPADVATGLPLTPTFSWTDASGETSYTLQIDDVNTFVAPLVYENTALPADSTMFTLPSAVLSPAATYSWRVIAVNGSGSTTASNAPFSFTTYSTAPGAFTLSSPASGATGQSLTPTLAWTGASFEDTYTLQIDDSGTFTLPLVYENTTLPPGTSNFAVPSATLLAGTTYWWRVAAVNALGSTPASNAPFSFTTTAAPTSFTLSTPVDGAAGQGLTPNLTWTDSGGEDSYTLEIDDAPGFTVPLVYQNTALAANTINFTVPGGTLSTGTTYYWRVTALNTVGQTTASNAPFSFVTASVPTAFTQSTPVDGLTGQPLAPTFTWSDSTNEATYTLQVDTDSGFAPPLVYENTAIPGNTTVFTLPAAALASGTTYFWRVIAVSAVGQLVASNAPFALTTFVETWTPTSTTGAPSARAGHSAIWTGRLMVVWGGQQFAGPELDSGGRYDPVSNSWTSTATSGAPLARQVHTAVWTGKEMIVWGGASGSLEHDSGGRYDPVTDAWTPTSTTSAPLARFGHSAVWTGRQMIVWGGTDGLSAMNTGGRYDAASDTWASTTTTGAASARQAHSAQWTGRDMLIWGGTPVSAAAGGRYDPVANTWTAMTTTGAPAGRRLHSTVWTGREMIVWGGYDNIAELATGAKYDPRTDTWAATSTAGAPSARLSHRAVWTGREMVVWGGGDFAASTYLDTGGHYDPVADSWTSTTTAGVPVGRKGHSAVWTGREMILWGGSRSGGFENSGGRYELNLFENAWTATPTAGAPLSRTAHTTVWTGREMIVWGGGSGLTLFNTGGRYDPISNAWSATTTTGAPTARNLHTAVWTGKEMIVWAGAIGSLAFTATGGRYDPVLDTWTATSTTGVPGARIRHTAVWTGREMVAWGGFGASPLNTGGRYDPQSNTWTATSSTGVPAARQDHTAAWTGREMIVWGGTDGTPLNSGGRYDAQTDSWTATTVTGAPGTRTDHTAIWTGRHMIVWGGNSGGALANGSRYDPIADGWTATGAAGAPSARFNATAVWSGCEMIVWGGDTGGGAATNAGGRYDPVSDTWLPTSTTGVPSARHTHTAVWTGGEMIVWGGTSTGGATIVTGGRLR